MFANILWGCEKPGLVLTDNRAVTRFFQTKIIPQTLWNVLDHVLSFDIILGHIHGKANLAADYLSRIHKNPKEKLTLRINSKIPISEVQIDTTAEVPNNSINTLLHETYKENTRKHYLFQTVKKKQIKQKSLRRFIFNKKTGAAPGNTRTQSNGRL